VTDFYPTTSKDNLQENLKDTMPQSHIKKVTIQIPIPDSIKDTRSKNDVPEYLSAYALKELINEYCQWISTSGINQKSQGFEET
jgi:hypothetical protein